MYDYILDGTNLCHMGSSQGPSLVPVFQIVQHLLAEEKSFLCLFDGNTIKSHLTDDLEKATYAAITVRSNFPPPIFAKGLFRQVKGKKADEEVLAKAQQNEEAYVISADRFDEIVYQRKYGWTDQQRKARLLIIYESQGNLTLTKTNGSIHATIKAAPDPKELFVDVINQIEAAQGRLQGIIRDLEMDKRIGRIHRRYASNMPLMFHESGLADESLSLSHAREEEVSFRIAAYYQPGTKKQPGKWGFQAQEIARSLSPETQLAVQQQQITELERKLKQAAATRETQAQMLTQQTAQIDLLRQELEAAQKQSQSRALEELQAQHMQLQAEYDQLEQDYQAAMDRQAELEAEVAQLKAQLTDQQQELQAQVMLISNLEEEKDQLEQMLETQAEVEGSELEEAYHSLQFDYESLRAMWRQEQVRVKVLRGVIGNDESQPLTQGVEVELAKMRHEIELLRQQNEELRREMLTVSAARETAEPQPEAVVEAPVEPPLTIPTRAPQSLSPAQWEWWLGFSDDLKRYFAFKYMMSWQAPEAKVLEELASAETLNLSGPSNARERLQNIPILRNLQGLDRLHQLRVLNLSHHQIQTIDHLLPLTQLEELYLSDNQVRSLTGIDQLTHLRELFIDSNLLTDLDGLARLPLLEDLNVRSNPGLSPILVDRLDQEKLNPNLLIRR